MSSNGLMNIDDQTPDNSSSGTWPDRSATPATVARISGTPIALGDGEVLWRQYPVMHLRRPERGSGTLYVTDSRVIFHTRAQGWASSSSSELVQETKLEHITGISAYVSTQVNPIWVIVPALFGLASILAFLQAAPAAFFAFAVLAGLAGLLLVYLAAKQRRVGVRIQSGSTQAGGTIGFGTFEDALARPQHVVLSRLRTWLGVNNAFDVLFGYPAPEAERAISELGALIIDLQSKGSLSGTHWGVTVR